MLVKVKQMQISSSVKQLSCAEKKDSKNNSNSDSTIQEAIDLSIENYRLRKRY